MANQILTILDVKYKERRIHNNLRINPPTLTHKNRPNLNHATTNLQFDIINIHTPNISHNNLGVREPATTLHPKNSHKNQTKFN